MGQNELTHWSEEEEEEELKRCLYYLEFVIYLV